MARRKLVKAAICVIEKINYRYFVQLTCYHHVNFMTDYVFYPKELCRQNANANTEVNTTSMLINVLCGDVSPPSEETNDNKITHPIEAVTHANFLPPL